MLKHTLHKKTVKKAGYRYGGSGSGGGGGAGPNPPHNFNPSWDVKLIKTSSPGFVTCDNYMGSILLGTCEDTGGNCFLQRLDYNTGDNGSYSDIENIKSFNGKSIHHIRGQDSYCYFGEEEGSFWKTITPATTPEELISRDSGYANGFCDGLDAEGYGFALESGAGITRIYRAVAGSWAVWVDTANFSAKDMVYHDGYLWLAVSKGAKAEIVSVKVSDGTFTEYDAYDGTPTSIASQGGKIWMTAQACIYTDHGDKYTLQGNTAWFVGTAGDKFFATSSTGYFDSKEGTSYIFVYENNELKKIAELSGIVEPWCICEGLLDDTYILVTRNKKDVGSYGNIYELTYHSTPVPIQPTHASQIGQVSEYITDICKVGNDIYFSPYLSYSGGKIYKYNGSLHTVNVPGSYESIYRVWYDGALCLGTEQPPTYIRDYSVTKTYASHGWAVLGNIASDGSVWRGWSYRDINTTIYKNDQLFTSLGKRIVWWIEYFNGKYYACTSSTTGYKNANDGKIYEWSGSWGSLNAGKIGGVNTAIIYNNAIFFGTVHPQSILRFDGSNWNRWDFSSDLEVSKFWIDDAGRLFCGTVTSSKMIIRQWCNNAWPAVWSINAKPSKWCVQGVAVTGGMVISFRDGSTTKIWKLDY